MILLAIRITPEQARKQTWVMKLYVPLIRAAQMTVAEHCSDEGPFPEPFPLCKENVMFFFNFITDRLMFRYNTITVCNFARISDINLTFCGQKMIWPILRKLHRKYCSTPIPAEATAAATAVFEQAAKVMTVCMN